MGQVRLNPMARPVRGHCFSRVEGEEPFQHPLVLPHAFFLEVSQPSWARRWLPGG